jgi:hypothetical protein
MQNHIWRVGIMHKTPKDIARSNAARFFIWVEGVPPLKLTNRAVTAARARRVAV